MKQKMKLALTALLAGLCLGGCVFLGTQEAGAVGVIGGADGPTAIYTATQLAPSVLAIAIPLVIIVAAVVVGVVLYIRRKKK